MKKLILFFTALVLTGSLYSQDRERPGAARTQTTIPALFYAEIVVTESEKGSKVTLQIDDNFKSFVSSEGEQKMLTGLQSQEFGSATEALNFLSSNGWEYVDQFNVSRDKFNERRILVRKRPVFDRTPPTRPGTATPEGREGTRTSPSPTTRPGRE